MSNLYRFIPFTTLLRFYNNANDNLYYWEDKIINNYNKEFNSINCDKFLTYEVGYQLLDDNSIRRL